MELTVLGKYGPYPKPGGAASGYLVSDCGEILLLDMGCGVLSRLLKTVEITRLKHIFISHLHYDHTSDLLPFRYLLEESGHTVNVYVHADNSEWCRLLLNHPNYNVINIDENTEINIGEISLSFRKMSHSSEDYAVIVKGGKTLCYTGDTSYNDNLDYCFAVSDAVLADCSKPESEKSAHMTVCDAKRLAEKYSSVKIFATHQSAEYDPAEDLNEYDNIISVEEMKTYTI